MIEMVKNRITTRRSTSRRSISRRSTSRRSSSNYNKNTTTFSQDDTPDVFLKHTIHHLDKIDIMIVYCTSSLNPLSYSGHLYGIISKEGISGENIQCSFSFYPENYRNILSMYTSPVFSQKGVIVFPDPILSKEKRLSKKNGTILNTVKILSTTVGNRLEKVLEDSFQNKMKSKMKSKMKYSKYNYVVPTKYIYSILGKPLLFNSNCYNCATFFSSMIKDLKCNGIMPKSCKKNKRSSSKTQKRSGSK
jgi:hypothetical protein